MGEWDAAYLDGPHGGAQTAVTAPRTDDEASQSPPPPQPLREQAPTASGQRIALRPAIPDALAEAGAATKLGIPAPAALRDFQGLSAALGPLMVREPRPPFTIDVNATIETLLRSIDPKGGLRTPIVPVPQKGERRWLRAVLIQESGPQMPIWGPTLRELSQLLGRRGAFRTILRQELGVADTGETVLRDPVTRREQSAMRMQWHRDELIIVVSDFVSEHWWKGDFPACLSAWSRSQHVLLLHLLPRRLWEHTWTGPSDVSVAGQVPGGSSASLLVSEPLMPARRNRHRPRTTARAIAVATLGATDLNRWALVVVAQPGRCDGLSLSRRLEPILEWPLAAEAVTEAVLRQNRAEAFKARASPTARKLARYLAVTAPLTLPMMRWVATALVPECDAGHVAEFFLGGLLESAGRDSNGEPIFDLHQDLRDHLTQGMPIAEALAVIDAIGDRIMQANGRDGDAVAFVSAGDIGALPEQAADLRAFAAVTRAFLIRSGRLAPETAGDSRANASEAEAGSDEGMSEPGHPSGAIPSATAYGSGNRPRGEHLSVTEDGLAKRDDFLGTERILDAVRELGRLDLDEVPTEQLLIFSTPQQQTWLVITQRSIVIVLDDANTRQSGRLVQRVMTHANAIPISARISKDGVGTIGFGRIEPRWYYSASLFATPKLLERSISNLVSKAAATIISRTSAHAIVMAQSSWRSSLLPRAVNADAEILRTWLLDGQGGGVSSEELTFTNDDRWESLRRALADHFDRADEKPTDASHHRRLYLYLACRCSMNRGRLDLQFLSSNPDEVSATPFEALETYLREQLDRRRYSEIVFIVDGFLNTSIPARWSSQLTSASRPLNDKGPSGSSYLRLLCLHSSASEGETIARRILRGLAGDAIEAATGAVTAGSLTRYLIAKKKRHALRVVIQQSGPDFLISIPAPEQAVGFEGPLDTLSIDQRFYRVLSSDRIEPIRFLDMPVPSEFGPVKSQGRDIPVLYVSETLDGALFEVLAHEWVPHEGVPVLKYSSIQRRFAATIRAKRPLSICPLWGTNLLRLGISTGDLYHSDASDIRRKIAGGVYEHFGNFDGLAWRSRWTPDCTLLMLFGDRCAAALFLDDAPRSLSDPQISSEFIEFAAKHGIRIID